MVEVTPNQIKYKKYSNQEGPLFTVNQSDLISLTYENGETQKFNTSTSSSFGSSNNTGEEYSAERESASYDPVAETYGKGFDNGISLYLQDGWGIGWDIRYNFNKWVCLDIAGINYQSGFVSPADYGIVNFRFAGIRAYTPSWKMFRGYVNLDLGYSLSYYTMPHIYSNYSSKNSTTDISHAFGLDFGIGVQVHRHIALGYSLTSFNGNKPSNWFKLSFIF